MKVIVTGANSLIGDAIICQLLLKNHMPIGLARHFDKKRKFKKKVIDTYCDYPKKIEKADIIIHLAWMGTTQDQRVNEKLQEKNYKVSLAMAKRAFNVLGVKRFILAGSQAEYGPHNGLITEKTSIAPNTAYGKYKNKLFETLKHSYPNKTIIDARIFSCYGPRQKKNQMIPVIIEKMLKNERCEFTRGTQLWNYIYVDDLAKIFVELCTIKTKSVCVNIASNDTRPLKEMIMDMKNVTKTKSRLVFGAVPYNSSGFISLNPSIKRLKKMIPNMKFTPFKIGVKKVMEQIEGELL